MSNPEPFRPGDTVKATRELYRGRIPVGAEGTFLRYGVFEDPWNHARLTPCAVVDFPNESEARVGLRVLRLVRPVGAERPASPNVTVTVANAGGGGGWASPVTFAPSAPKRDAAREAQKHSDLAAAHERVARALENLRKVEESYR